MAKFDHLKKSMGDFYLKNKNLQKKEIFRKFEGLGASKCTLNRWLDRLQKNKTLERKNGSGRVAKKFSSKVIKAIKNKFDHKHGCSQRKVDSEFNITQLYVCKILKESSDINCYKKYKRSLMNAEQKKSLRPKCKQLVEKNCGDKLIIDDESYFTLLHTTLHGNVRFYSNNFQLMPDNVKYKYQAKYKSKLMVWITISHFGI